jgi:predicted membrane protein
MAIGPYVLRGILGVVLVVAAVGAVSRVNPRARKSVSEFSTDSGKLKSAVVAGEERRRYGSTFRSGKTDTVVGRQVLDLSEATMEGDQAEIKASVVMGELEIVVPRDWTVSRRHLGIFLGQMENRTRTVSDGEKRKTLEISGGIVFGHLIVRN